MANKAIEEQLRQLLPKSIDDVVRENRDKLRLALATDEDLKALETTIADASVRHQLAGWNVLMLHATTASGQVSSPRLIGRVLVHRLARNLPLLAYGLYQRGPPVRKIDIRLILDELFYKPPRFIPNPALSLG
jgi:hypothetical protein